MSEMLIESLPLAHRLALSYAPRATQAPVLALLALDQRLGAIVRGGGEPAIAQIKLAWWRERLSEPRDRWPAGEPLLALLQDWPGDTVPLAGMADGWEWMLAEELDSAAIEGFVEGRAAGWHALAQAVAPGDADKALATARHWVLADLLLHTYDDAETERVRAAREAEGRGTPRLPRALRPLAVLHALAGRALDRGSRDLLDGSGALATAMRVGILGR